MAKATSTLNTLVLHNPYLELPAGVPTPISQSDIARVKDQPGVVIDLENSIPEEA